MSHFARDLRYSVRMLVKSPGFTAAAVLTLALGIGLNTATFSVVNALLIRPLPGASQPERLVQIYSAWPGLEHGSSSIPYYQDVRDRSGDVFEEVAAWYFAQVGLSVDGQSDRLEGMLVSANFFQTYGASMTLGRPFLPGEESRGPGMHPVAVLGHSFWQTRFGGDPEIVGRTIVLNGRAFEVVGVVGSSFKGPVVFADVPLYVPLMMQPQIEPGNARIDSRASNPSRIVARLRDDRTLAQASEHMDALLVQLKEEHAEYDRQSGHTLVLQSDAALHPRFRGAQLGMSAAIMAVVGLLLLVACVNLANLLLARARERRREMRIRVSLGATRSRIVRQLLTESLVISLAGGLAGLAVAYPATRSLSVFRPPVDGPWAFDVGIDGSVLLFTLGIAMGAGVLFGLVPALEASRRDTAVAVKPGAGSPGRRSRRGSSLVIVQVALSLVLLISAGLFLRSLQRATSMDPGFSDPSTLVMASIDPSLQGYEEERTRAFYDRLLTEAGALSEVTAVGLTTSMPLGFSGSKRGVSIPGYELAPGEPNAIRYAMISEGYLEAMGTRLVEGRTFTRQDDGAGAPVIIVNQRFAERFWPGASAVGSIVETAGAERRVIGVVETGRYQRLGEAPQAFMYLPQREIFRPDLTVVARARSDPQAALRAIQHLVRQADPHLPVVGARTGASHMGLALLPARLGGTALGLFGVLGLALAAVGIYGVMAYSVAQRQRELAVRIALGAGRGRVVTMVLREGLWPTAVGTVVGLVGAAAAARLLAGVLYDVSALDPVAFLGVPVLLMAVATAAVLIPARRASAADPMRALRLE